MCMGDSIATMYVTFYLRFISNNVHGLIWAGFTINIVSVIAAFWMIESPAWLISAGETKWAEKEIQYIAKFNGVQNLYINNIVPNEQPGDETQETDKVSENEKKFIDDDIIEDNDGKQA